VVQRRDTASPSPLAAALGRRTFRSREHIIGVSEKLTTIDTRIATAAVIPNS
jgi:hypothetical protein